MLGGCQVCEDCGVGGRLAVVARWQSTGGFQPGCATRVDIFLTYFCSGQVALSASSIQKAILVLLQTFLLIAYKCHSIQNCMDMILRRYFLAFSYTCVLFQWLLPGYFPATGLLCFTLDPVQVMPHALVTTLPLWILQTLRQQIWHFKRNSLFLRMTLCIYCHTTV